LDPFDTNLPSFLLCRGGSMAGRSIRLAGSGVALSLPITTPLYAQYDHRPPPPLPGPPYAYGPMPAPPYAIGSTYYGCPAGYLTIRGDICEPYLPLMGRGPRGPDGCPPHYIRDGTICKPARH